MTKKSTLLVFLFLFAAGFSFAQSAQSPDATATSQPAAATANAQFNGTIDKIDLEAKSITIKDEAGNTTKVYTFNDATVFTRDDAPFTVDTLKVGDKVMVEVDAASNGLVALKINTEPAATPESTTPKDDDKEQKQDKDKD